MNPLLLILSCLLLPQDEFSGPQKGEPLPDFEVKVIFGPDEGKSVKLHEQIQDKPTLVIFIHEITRPSIALIRTITNYARKRGDDGMGVQLVFLTADPTDTQNFMTRAKRALPTDFNNSISMDGIEGPGAYGLNRKMQITCLVAKSKKVTANFAIIQPSIQADAVKICSAIAKTLGDTKMPTVKELGIVQRGKRPAAGQQDRMSKMNAKYGQLMRAFIQKSDTDEQTEMRAKEIEAEAEKDPALKKKIFQATNLIINGGKLENYGTKKAQSYLKKWAKEFGSRENKNNDAKKKNAKKENAKDK